MKKNIYSKLIMALAVVLMPLALTGCGNEDVWIYPILVSGDGVNINTHELTIEKGNTLQLKAQRDFITHGQGMAWKSSDPEVATVDKNGLLTAIKAGEVKITAYTTGGKVSEEGYLFVKVVNIGIGLVDDQIDQSDAE
jgi:uncharacterized protein YjdB